MASEIATPAKDAAATEAEVVSVDLPAPAGWNKKVRFWGLFFLISLSVALLIWISSFGALILVVS